MRAERRMGVMIRETDLNQGGRPGENRSQVGSGFKLSDLGINFNQSSRWQAISRIPVTRCYQFS